MVLKRVSPSDIGPKEFKGSSPLVSGPFLSPRLVVLDFDGTLTQVRKEAASFEERYRHELADLIGYRERDLTSLWEESRKSALSDPLNCGWKIGGKIVAAGYADPYIMTTLVAVSTLDSLKILMDPHERTIIMDGLFHRNYANNEVFFREDAGEFLEELGCRKPLVIVTSSLAGTVERKLERLKLRNPPVIYGSAQKYILDDSWDAVPELISIPGLDRPVYLRRKKYWDILDRVLSGHSIRNEHAMVVGDIFELDLSLPGYLGMGTCLITKESTPQFEKDAVLANSGMVVDSLSDCLSVLTDKLAVVTKAS